MTLLDLPAEPGHVVRSVVRVLLFDPDDRLLLARLNLVPGPTWTPVGGGIDPGEDLVTAVRREVAEETGCTAFELGREVWRVRYCWLGGNGVRYDSRERHFVARCRPFEPVDGGRTDLERRLGMITQWWTAADLAAANLRSEPPDLAARVAELLGSGPAAEPTETDYGVV
ncbi:MAG TPA: NUDIX domain-containing protein [Mycobacteriales bacterium]